VRGLINVQYAVRGDTVYVLEVNPRASRTVPFVAKATGVPWANIATKVILGKSLAELGITKEIRPKHSAVKAPVFPWSRFPGVDPVLGPEMKSTGEVMGIDRSFGIAFAKSQMAAGNAWAPRGKVFVSVNNHDKRDIVGIAKRLDGLGLVLVATHGTASVLRTSGLEVEELPKVQEGTRPNILDRMKNGEIAFLINTPSGRHCRPFEISIRATAVRLGVPLVTTLSGAAAVILGLEEMARGAFDVRSLQEYQQDLAAARG